MPDDRPSRASRTAAAQPGGAGERLSAATPGGADPPGPPAHRAAPLPATGPEVAAQGQPAAEPVWLVRLVLLLFLVGFTMFLAHEVRDFWHSLSRA